MKNWTNIQIEDGRTEWNGRRTLYHQCQIENRQDGRCGADAMYLVTRTSTFSGNTYTDHMCARHAESWKQAVSQ